MTFNNETKFKTFQGGILSVLLILAFFGFFVFEAKDVWNKTSTSKQSLEVRNLAFDTRKVELLKDNFDFAIKFAYYGVVPDVLSNLSQYIDIRAQ